MGSLRVFLPLFIFIGAIVGCGESNGDLFDNNASATGNCENNISTANTVKLLKDHNLTYNNEVFYFGFDGINDYEASSDYKDGGTYDRDRQSNELGEMKDFLFYVNDDGNALLSGDLNGSIELYCVDRDSDGKAETTWIRYKSSTTQKAPLKAVKNNS